MSSMMMVFTNAHNIPLYSTAWTPNSAASFAGTCIFLVILASILRCPFAFKPVLESKGFSMLAVMMMNVGYFMLILAGTFLGELVVGRYIHSDDH